MVSSCDLRLDSKRDSANCESHCEEEALRWALVNASEAYVMTVR